jgi:phosphoenolpyruvate carboxylase
MYIYSAQENKEENLETAFKIAENVLKIPRLLNARQLANEQYDDRSVALYVSLFLNAFQNKMERKKITADHNAISAQLKELETRLQKSEKEKEELVKIRGLSHSYIFMQSHTHTHTLSHYQPIIHSSKKY